jgi:oligopeptide transport system ATP-binding protein
VQPLLSVKDLTVQFRTSRGLVTAVNGVSFDVGVGEALGLVGESGSGKSVTCLSILRMLPKPAAEIVRGRIELKGVDLLSLSEREMARSRGRNVSMITQDPMTSLDPLFTIGDQVAETFKRPGNRRTRVRDLLGMVRIPAPDARISAYPHQLSGGMRQRVVAAISLASEPALLLADEPTTSLDVTVQMQFLDMLRAVQRDRGLAMVLVTHDLSIVARVCDRVAVMYAGRIVETATTEELFSKPRHPYTQALLRSVPRLGDFEDRLRTIEGQPPDLAALPSGCPFAPRCSSRMDRCFEQEPPRRRFSASHDALCWLEDSAPEDATW